LGRLGCDYGTNYGTKGYFRLNKPRIRGYAAACKAVYTGSIPVGASRSGTEIWLLELFLGLPGFRSMNDRPRPIGLGPLGQRFWAFADPPYSLAGPRS
jgi:hypothetical protein